MEDMYAVLFSSISVYDKSTIDISHKIKKVLKVERHVNQCELEVWFYGTIEECVKWLNNFYINLSKYRWKEFDLGYDRDGKLVRCKWWETFNTNKYDNQKSLQIAPILDIFKKLNEEE